jgi:hypothetical protein
MIFTAGKDQIRVYDMQSDVEIAKFKINGTVKYMKLSIKKSKLIVSSYVSESKTTEFHVFFLKSISRDRFNFPG